MKHKLLFALAGALMSMSAMAWDAPTRPTMPTFPQYEGTWVAPENDGTYYIYNVGTGQFLGCGNDWGTRAVTTNVAVLALDDAQWNCGANKNTILPFQLHQTDLTADMIEDETLEGTWQIFNLNTNKSGGDKYLCHEGNAAWIDGGIDRRNTDKNGFWNLNPVDGAYELLPLDGQEGNSIVYGVHLPNLASALTFYTWTDLQNNADASAKWKFVSTDDVESIRTYIAEVAASDYPAAFDAYKAAMNVYNAKNNLYKTLLDADKYGADTSEAGAVYTNPDATVEEVNAANTALQEAIKPLAIEYGCTHSSEEEPFDVTGYVMTNPDFSASCNNGATPPGWEITIKGQNVGQQNRTDTNSETGASITNFLECWIPAPGTLGNGYAGQWITGLPQGRYRLEMDATACQQSGAIAVEDLVGVSLFVGTGSYNIMGDPVQTGDRMVQHYTFDFDFNADRLLVGLLVENTNCNWISADNFKLYAIGAMKEDPNKKGLEEAIEKAEALADNLVGNDIEDPTTFNINKDVAAAFEQALEDARAALSASGDDMKAAVEALGAATDAANKSHETYVAYQKVYNDALVTAQRLTDANQWPDLRDEITDFAEVELTEAFNAGTLTDEGLAEAQGKVTQLIADYLNDPEKIQVGDDLTVLLVNPDFTYGTTADPTGWVINSGSMTELATSTQSIETWHKTFDLSQTLHNMPAGVYDITLQGFARHDNTAVTDKSWLYGGISKAFLISLDEDETQMREEPLYLPDVNPDNPYLHDGNYDAMGTAGYKCNGMGGSYYWFRETNPNTGEPYYLNHCKVILDQPGDLTIGIRSEATEDWVIFSHFGISYQGQDLTTYYNLIADKGDELQAAADNNYPTTQADALVSDLQARIENAFDITSVDEALALLADIEAGIDYLKAGQKLVDEITPLAEEYETMANEKGIEDAAFSALLEEINDKISEYENFQSNEEIAKYMEDLKKAWVNAMVSGAEVGDYLDGIILNPDFETGNINYWTDTFTAGNHGFQNNATYNDEAGSAVISNFAECWNNDHNLVNGEISQTLAAPLPEGNYQLEVDGYAINQSQNGGIREDGIQGVYLFVKIGDEIIKQSIAVDGVESADNIAKHWTLGFHSNGTETITVGVMAEDANCNWTAFDNFKLMYFADQEPTAVDAIEVKAVAPKAIYTIDGRRTNALRRGINIVRKADGSVEKVLVK